MITNPCRRCGVMCCAKSSVNMLCKHCNRYISNTTQLPASERTGTTQRNYSDEELEFMKAMDSYKRDKRRPFPTWSEVLMVVKSLGYEKQAESPAA